MLRKHQGEAAQLQITLLVFIWHERKISKENNDYNDVVNFTVFPSIIRSEVRVVIVGCDRDETSYWSTSSHPKLWKLTVSRQCLTVINWPPVVSVAICQMNVWYSLEADSRPLASRERLHINEIWMYRSTWIMIHQEVKSTKSRFIEQINFISNHQASSR